MSTLTPPQLTYPQLVVRRAAEGGDRELAVDPSERLTYAQFANAMMQAARGCIAEGVQPGDKVAVWAPNSVRWLVAALGASAAGAVIVPMNTRFRGLEAMAAVRRVRPRLLFTTRAFLGTDYPAMLRAAAEGDVELRIVVLDADAQEPDLDWQRFLAGGASVPLDQAEAVRDTISPDAAADIILTSGTTGEPKGVVSTHTHNQVAWTRYLNHLGLRDGERINATLPFFHNFGLKAGFLIAALLGGTVVTAPVFDPAGLAHRIISERISYLPGTPTLFEELLTAKAEQGLEFASLRHCMLAGTRIPVELVERVKRELGIDAFTGYGLSELAGGVALTPQGASAERISQWAGKVVEGVELRVVDEFGDDVATGVPGEILARSDVIMLGYLDDTSSTAATVDAEGWLHTGDIGVVDEQRFVKIVDRKKEMFIVGGFNAYPADIEALLLRQGQLAQVAVVSMADQRLGEVAAAFVVPLPGQSPEPEEIIAWARANMANYKVPRKVIVVDALPMNASMKVVKGELYERLAAAAAVATG